MDPDVHAACQRVLLALQIYVQLSVGKDELETLSCVAQLELIAIELEGLTEGEWEDGT